MAAGAGPAAARVTAANDASATAPAVATVTAHRYVQPLREGGSLPAVVEDADGALWVTKFRGAGQGARVLIAELVVGLLAQTLGLPVPALAVVDVPSAFGRIERDSEIQDLLRKSEGVNVGLRYLDGAFNFDPLAAGDYIDPAFAAHVVWLDTFTTNPDRSARNPNLMIWERAPWLIDHGAALYVQHDWRGVDETRARSVFPLVRQHVLLAASADLREADAALAPRVTDEVLGAIVARVPDALFEDSSGPVGAGEFEDAAAARARYAWYLGERLRGRAAWLDAAVAAREAVRAAPPARLRARR